MAISKVGLGWPAGERNYDTLRAWRDAKRLSSEHETAVCSGYLGNSFVTLGSSDFVYGSHIYGIVPFDGSNKDQLARLDSSLGLTSTTGYAHAHDLYVRHGSTTQNALSCSQSNLVERCYVEHTAATGTNTAILDVFSSGVARNCIALSIHVDGSATIRTGSGGSAYNCVGIGGKCPFISQWSNTTNQNIFALNNTYLSDITLTNNAQTVNSASSDSTGNYTGYTTAEFVNFAAGDYRIKSTSDLKALGIGAFFEQNIQASGLPSKAYINNQFKVGTFKVYQSGKWITAQARI